MSEPCLRGNEWAYLKECLDSGWISSAGPFVERFERKFAGFLQLPLANAVAVVNGTAGLHIALRVAGVAPNDEVLVPSLTFIAPVNAIHYCGAHPVFVDANPITWQMDVEQIQVFLEQECEIRETGPNNHSCWNTRTNRRIRAMLPVHILGLACAMDRIRAVAQQYHLFIIEDAAEAIGVRYEPLHVGLWGHIGVFSFNGNKTITCGGGGMIVTKDNMYADDARYLTTQARDDVREYHHKEIGYNYRLTSLQAAVGLAQLEQLPAFLEKKRRIAGHYHEAFAGAPQITPMPRQDGAAYWLYTILLPDRATRDILLARLAEERIEARPLWQPIHTLPPYKGGQSAGPIEVATELYDRGVSLPSSVGLTEDDLGRCIEVVRQVTGR